MVGMSVGPSVVRVGVGTTVGAVVVGVPMKVVVVGVGPDVVGGGVYVAAPVVFVAVVPVCSVVTSVWSVTVTVLVGSGSGCCALHAAAATVVPASVSPTVITARLR